MEKRIREINLRLFDTVTQTTLLNSPGNDLSPEIKTYYSDYLIDNATPNLVHDQFGQKVPIPKGHGKTVEFRKYSPLRKATKPLTEGVTPDGNNLNVTTLTATVAQYGDWIRLSDMLILTAIDNNVVQATKLLGDQSGKTLDTITREILSAGTNVMYAPNGSTEVTSRASITSANRLTVELILKAATVLKGMNTQNIDGSYVCIVHPYIAYDLMNDDRWIDAHKYAKPDNIYEGELGKIGNVRFVESTEAKIFAGADLTAASRNLTVKTALASSGKTIAVNEAISVSEAEALSGRSVLIGNGKYNVASSTPGAAGSASITLTTDVAVADGQAGNVVYPGEGGAGGISVYSTLILGANAYGVTDIEEGGLQHIVKQLGSAGTADPLNQRASVGWKAIKTAEILVQEYMVRIESCCTFKMAAAN